MAQPALVSENGQLIESDFDFADDNSGIEIGITGLHETWAEEESEDGEDINIRLSKVSDAFFDAGKGQYVDTWFVQSSDEDEGYRTVIFDNEPEAIDHYLQEVFSARPGGVEVLRALIFAYKLTLSDLEAEIGKKSMVSLVLNGQRQLTVDHIFRLCQRFGLSPEIFFKQITFSPGAEQRLMAKALASH
ncbi:helix-turn-helix domain-containing protein [Salmonella enterica]|nr:helix-turn-helix domain-containing protein [Salmonella enterica]